MLAKRIIPCLDIKDGKVVKGVNFVGLKDVGDPIELAKEYDRQSADEVVFLDITATYENRDIIKDLIQRGADELSIPLCVGGGIRTVEDFRMILAAGADKVSVNSAAVKNPNIIKEASDEFGVKKCESLGAGEILLTSMDADGTRDGFDIDMLKAVVAAVNIPVIASGGCGGKEDIVDVFKETDCDAALAASLFHFGEATVDEVKESCAQAGIPVRRNS